MYCKGEKTRQAFRFYQCAAPVKKWESQRTCEDQLGLAALSITGYNTRLVGTIRVFPQSKFLLEKKMRTTFIRLAAILLLTLFTFDAAYAVLDLELTRGISSAVPIAIVPFQAKSKLPVDITQVITRDLYNSGEFKPLNIKRMKQFPHQLSEVNFQMWQQSDVDYLIMGRVQSKGQDRYQIRFELINVCKANRHQTNSKSIIMSQEYTVQSNHLRHLAHAIADSIYKKLTGERGIFSTKIAYVLEKRFSRRKSQYALMVADADGYHPKPILVSDQPIMSPTWSHDGKKIAYVSFEHLRTAVYISDVVTGKRQLVSSSPGVNSAPAFSPDDEKLAFVLSKGDSLKIYIMDLRTERFKQVTHGWSIDTEPAWSPDGRSLFFTSDRSGSPQIYQLDIASGVIQRLTYNGSYNAGPSFVPGSKSIVMMHRDHGEYNIVKQDLRTGALLKLTHSSDNQSPDVSPNGKMVIYTSQEKWRDVLRIVSIDGRVKLRLPENGGSVREPVWQPFQRAEN
jgi:TolB protein